MAVTKKKKRLIDSVRAAQGAGLIALYCRQYLDIDNPHRRYFAQDIQIHLACLWHLMGNDAKEISDSQGDRNRTKTLKQLHSLLKDVAAIVFGELDGVHMTSDKELGCVEQQIRAIAVSLK